ncbi:CU044_5270 family protein [Plantactinospora sp. CA-294935]|uniref:CU044_5270 family protein n=1 Tax=Plantactinospora sp. CA-294935 TaxID=3240012 RepID=UPI003D94EC6B
MSSRSTLAPYGRSTVAVLAAGAVLALVAVTSVIARPSQPPTPAHAVASAGPSPATAPTPVTARDRLPALAARLAATPDDAHRGPYTYVHTHQWARAGNVLARVESEQWRHPNGSGLIVERRLPDRAGLTGRPGAKDLAAFRRADATGEEYLPGRLAPELPEPIPSEPGALAAQLLTIVPPQSGPNALVTAVANIHRAHYLDQRQRAAVLRVLAPIPRLRYDGDVTDIAGRSGFAVTVTNGGSTTTLVFDHDTGALLAYQETVNTQPPSLFQYQLFTHGRRSRPGR